MPHTQEGAWSYLAPSPPSIPQKKSNQLITLSMLAKKKGRKSIE